MAQKKRIAKMFGVLVLGGAMLAKAEETPKSPKTSAEPQSETDKTQTPAINPSPATKPRAPTVKRPEQPSRPTLERTPKFPKASEICQVELTLHKYDRDGVTPVKTCLDGKSSDEIMKLVEKAKKQTCQSPFCGCWLG